MPHDLQPTAVFVPRFDVRGVPVTSACDAAVTKLDEAVLGLVGHRADTGLRVEQALALDPELVVGLCLRGFGARLLARADLLPTAQAARDAAVDALATRGGVERERLLVAALDRWLGGDPFGAIERLDAMLRLDPRDLLAIKLAHALRFVMGLATGMRRSVARVLPAWDESVPGFAFVLGCHAFALEETGELALAEHVGRRAVELDPRDVWGAHAVGHVLETLDRCEEGVAWLGRIDVRDVNNFAGHVAWHQALFHLGHGEPREALALYDAHIAVHLGRDYRDVANATTLLWRFERIGLDVGARWEPLADFARARSGDHVLGFADVHYALALAGSGDTESARRLVDSMRAHADERVGVDAAVLDAVGVPLAEAICAAHRGAFDRAVDLLLAVRPHLPRLGGSHAQRDAFELLLMDCTVRGTRPELARAVVDARLARRPRNAFARACRQECASP